MYPHGVSGIGYPARRESVSCEQIAELIVPARLRNSNDRDEGGAKCEAEHGNQQNGHPRRLAIFAKLCSARTKKVAFLLRPDRNIIAATVRTITASIIVSTQDARRE